MTKTTLPTSSRYTVKQLIRRGQAVIEAEANALIGLKSCLDNSFANACEHLLQCQGRLIVLGIGKSGHIGRKIAATLASTGTPSFFVHPGEMSHGDLGMLTKQDVLLVLSHSGETIEIIDLLPHFHRLQLPIIALTRPDSTLAKSATITLKANVDQEAGELGLAPTTSTTVALALGDALAITVYEAKGFNKNDFSLFHPGGALGKHLLLKVDDIMHRDQTMPRVTQGTLLDTAILEVTEKRLGMTTVLDHQGKLIGIYTDGDIRRNVQEKKDFHTTLIEEVMSTDCKTIQPGTDAAQALEIMERYKITALVVTTENNEPLGVIHMHDLLQLGFYST